MFSKKKKADGKQEDKVVLGMIMLNDTKGFNIDVFIEDYRTNYVTSIEVDGTSEASAFVIDGETCAIGFMPVPIPGDDIESTTKYAYNWVHALEQTKDHQSHIIVCLLKGSKEYVKRHNIFTNIICSLLRTTDSIGVYTGNQSLLIHKEDYLNEAGLMDEEYLPLNIWVYFGLRENSDGNSGYTFGLKEFGKSELEVLDTNKTIEEIRGFLFNTAHYVLEYDVVFKDGETTGSSEDERIPISFSAGIFVEGMTFKFGY